MIIAVDFDGTCVEHKYPEIGPTLFGAVDTLKQLARNHQLILWTMRSGETLQDAVTWFKENEIPLWGINENPDQHRWTQSLKAYAQLYIDDAAFGAPLIYPKDGRRPFLNWEAVRRKLFNSFVVEHDA